MRHYDDIARSSHEARERIAADDAEIRAWVAVGPASPAPSPAGAFDGLPFGVKDVIDVVGLPTNYGLAWQRDAAIVDAWCVAALRAAGAVPVGKTQTTALAFRDPAPTRNPYDATRTPGGSSAGSAAAVAAGHVPFALGTQTVGSTIRPACFCGVVGYKPTFGVIPVQGVAPQAPSFDTVGIIAATVNLARQVADVFLPPAELLGDGVPRIGFAPSAFAAVIEPAVFDALGRAARHLADNGAHVSEIALPDAVEQAIAPHWTISTFEANAVLRPLRHVGFPPLLEAFITGAVDVSAAMYRDALVWRARAKAAVVEALDAYDVVMLACANPAPARDTTGDTTPLMPWTFWGAPALTLPIAISSDGLPIGMQLVAAPGRDRELLAAATWIERCLAHAVNPS